jgi:ribosomal protein L29
MATKTKKKENYKDMKEGELSKQLGTLREEVRVIKFKAEGSRSKNVKELGNLKKQIARIMTSQHKK